MSAGSHASAANITYNFSLLDNGQTEMGTITTDGTIGVLAPSDIVSFSFTGPATISGVSKDISGAGPDLTATGKGLFFDFTDTSNNPDSWFFSNVKGGIGSLDVELITGTSNDGFVLNLQNLYYVSETGNVEIATVATTPLPGSLSLLLTGAFGTFAFVNRKKLFRKSNSFAL